MYFVVSDLHNASSGSEVTPNGLGRPPEDDGKGQDEKKKKENLGFTALGHEVPYVIMST